MHWSRKEGFINKDTWAFRSSQGQKIGDVKPAPHQNLGVDGLWTCCFFLFPMQFRGLLSAWLEVAASMGLKDDLNLPCILLGWVSRKMCMVSLGSRTYECLQTWIGLLWDGAGRRPCQWGRFVWWTLSVAHLGLCEPLQCHCPKQFNVGFKQL